MDYKNASDDSQFKNAGNHESFSNQSGAAATKADQFPPEEFPAAPSPDRNQSDRHRVVTEEDILAARFGKKPAEFCPEVREIFTVLGKSLKLASLEELNVIETVIKHRKKELKAETLKSKVKSRRNFYQIEVREDVFVWYIRERENGKLSNLKHFGNSLPDDIDLDQDSVNFDPKYTVERHSDWLKLPEKT